MEAQNQRSILSLNCDLLLVAYDWHLEPFAASQEPIEKSTQKDGTKNRTSIVHVVLVDWKGNREWHPQHRVREEAQAEEIERYTQCS